MELPRRTADPSPTSSDGIHSRTDKDALSVVPAKRRRTLASQACERCRRRKVRCDGQQPCGVCGRLNVACSYDDQGDRRRSVANQGDEQTRALMARLEGIERLLLQNGLQNGSRGDRVTFEPEEMSDGVHASFVSQMGAEIQPQASFSGALVAPGISGQSHFPSFSAAPLPPAPLPVPPGLMQPRSWSNESVLPWTETMPSGLNANPGTSGPSTIPAAPKLTAQTSNARAEPSFENAQILEHDGAVAASTRLTGPFSDIRQKRSDFERLKRRGHEGRLLQFGETSLFSHLPEESRSRTSTPLPDSESVAVQSSAQTSQCQDEASSVDWSQSLPTSLQISKETHDRALDHFEAYFASWCLVVDFPRFRADLLTCNTVHSMSAQSPRRAILRETAHYSPLLHSVVLFMGMYYGRAAWPEATSRFTSVFLPHAMELMRREAGSPPLSTVRAVNLLATALSEPPVGHASFGYSMFGIVIAMAQTIGLNVPCQSYVDQGRITQEEKRLRDYAYWSVYMYDILRAIAAGRPPLMSAPPIELPEIWSEMDDTPWIFPAQHALNPSLLGATLSRLRSMRSTVFHWSTRLAKIYAEIRSTLYPVTEHDSEMEERVQELSSQLDQWYSDLPSPLNHPPIYPLPHVILLHMTFHLISIFLYRPFYRSSRTQGSDGDKSPAKHCDAATEAILQMLKLYDLYHSVRCGPGTLINIMFSTTTTLLMEAVEEQNQKSAVSPITQEKILQMFTFMRSLSEVFWEAGRGVIAALSLCAEWLPGVFELATLGGELHEAWTRSMARNGQVSRHQANTQQTISGTRQPSSPKIPVQIGGEQVTFNPDVSHHSSNDAFIPVLSYDNVGFNGNSGALEGGALGGDDFFATLMRDLGAGDMSGIWNWNLNS